LYEIRSLLGEGGMGQVFEAHDLSLNRRVAIKASWPITERGLIRREAMALAAIRHPSMVVVHGVGEHAGVEYAVMERVYGVPLDDYLARRKTIALRDVLAILIPLADALSAVHAAGIAHRDIKPANIMLAPRGRLVLMDFGIFLSESQLGDQAYISGTPEYMAPETIMGKIEARAAAQVDLYAFGILAYQMITGELPFTGDDRRVTLNQHLLLPVPPLTGVPPKLASLVAELLAKDPDQRPASMEVVMWRLRAIDDALRDADEPGEAVAEEGDAAKEKSAPGPFHVLVVDDDAAIRKLLSMIVKRALPAATIDLAKDANEALERLRAHAPDLMLLDLHMPKMSGVELCMYLRGAPHLAERCTIVPVSAGAQEPDLQLLHMLGITHFVAKGARLADRLGPIMRDVYESHRQAANGR
jgi:eukaryotic-like serine/threonine-protein kinase